MINSQEIFNNSWDRIDAHQDAFLTLFYQNFLDSSDEIKELFENVEMQNQKKMLRMSLLYLISYASSQLPTSSLKKLTQVHKKLNIRKDQYDLWMDTLIKTIQSLDPKFNNKVEQAWRFTFKSGLDFMKESS
ncbi:MAG: hypothetical protein COB02_06505 [Candidatus Cloacimonadota bacterium]|nr:MAG: hypothetical protein COB02_06505 [Candidatus Cloacimonadota bacterium]